MPLHAAIMSPVVPSHKIKLVNKVNKADITSPAEARKSNSNLTQKEGNQANIPRFESKLSSVTNGLETDLYEVSSNM